jgi:hypothetical protein
MLSAAAFNVMLRVDSLIVIMLRVVAPIFKQGEKVKKSLIFENIIKRGNNMGERYL